MSDELDDYEEGAERADALEDELERELELADAAELGDSAEEHDETRFDETRLAYSGVEEGDGDVDVQELEEAGARLDDPEREAPPTDR
jgi:plasmid stabilization system protein ParE